MPVLRVDAETCTVDDLRPAAEWLARDGIVLLPTDTFYGLAVDPRSATALRQLFSLKGRVSRAALPLIAASLRQVEDCCGTLDFRSARLAERFWPGPLSLVLDAPRTLAPEVHAG